MYVAAAVHIRTCMSLSSYVWVLQPGSLIAGLKPATRAKGGKVDTLFCVPRDQVSFTHDVKLIGDSKVVLVFS